MTDAPKNVPPAAPAQPKMPTPPPRPPQAPPLKNPATTASLPNPTLPKPTAPQQGATLPGYGSGDLNKAQLPPLNAPANSIKPPAPTPVPPPPGRPMAAAMPPKPVTPAPQAGAPQKPAAQAPASSASAPKSAEIRKSPFRFLPFILGGLVLVGIIGFVLSKVLGGTGTTATPSGTATSKTPVTVTYWGLWEPSAVLTEVINDYQTSHPNVKIEYSQQSYRDYHDRLQTAISKKQGPDIFRYHASWVPMLRQELATMPNTVYSDTEYQNTFYPIAAKQLKGTTGYVGIPLEYDGLALYYNQDILNTANVQPPTTWADMKRIAAQLTVRDSTTGKISRAGLAIGNTTNVDHFSDILGLLLLQNGADPTNVTTQPAQDALAFYTSFVSQDKVWDATLPNSTTAFARGDVAMMFAPSWRAHDIQAMNPNLKFAVAAVPQLTANKVAWASYWAEGVNAQSTHQTEAWEFLKYMSSASTLQKLYSNASKVRAFGEVYSRKDLAGTLASDPLVGAYVSDAPFAQNWYLNSATHDNGINDNIIKYFEDAINQSGTGGTTMLSTMQTVQQGQAQILNQYGITVTTVPVAQ